MLKKWDINGKQGEIWYPKGEVVYQHPKGNIVIEPLYKSYDGKWYIEENGKLLEVLKNPFNGYCYRQDGR
ncbi:MAG: hypothetical protein WCS56_05765 [Bacilli bacterium]